MHCAPCDLYESISVASEVQIECDCVIYDDFDGVINMIILNGLAAKVFFSGGHDYGFAASGVA